jgi:hypothetical protein
VSLFLVLLNQRGQVVTEAEAGAVLVAAATLAVAGGSAALLAAALGPRQLSMAEAFEEHRLSAGHTFLAELSAGQVLRLDSIMVAVA